MKSTPQASLRGARPPVRAEAPIPKAARTRQSMLALLALSLSIPAHALPTQTLTIANPSATTAISLTAEIAATDGDRKTGLMNRPAMPEANGMLFLFPGMGQVGFWMRNTLIPLDMLFLRDGTVVGIHANALPMTETVITSPPEVNAVLEVNGGWAARHGVSEGWTVEPVSGRLPEPSAGRRR